MIIFREDFVTIPNYPGYYWSVLEKKLYSIKVDGILKPIKSHKGYNGGPFPILPGYVVSRDGIRKNLTLNYLNSLRIPYSIQNVEMK